MDRREALKKLAAGGAVAAGGSMVLSSNKVAYAASIGCVTGIPAPGDPLPITYAVTGPQSRRRIQVVDATTPACVDGGPVTTTHSWRINSFDVAGRRSLVQMRLWDAANTTQIVVGSASGGDNNYSTCGPACTSYSAPTSFTGFTLKKWFFGFLGSRPINRGVALRDGDSYEIDTLITWSCQGCAPVTAEYRIASTFPNTPTVTAL